MAKPPHQQQQQQLLTSAPVSLRSKKPAGPATRLAAVAAAAAAQERGVACKSIVSLNNWTDFFGSSLDLTSNVLTEFDSKSGTSEAVTAGGGRHLDRSSGADGSTGDARDLPEEEEEEEDADDLLLDPTDVVVLTNRQQIIGGRRASAGASTTAAGVSNSLGSTSCGGGSSFSAAAARQQHLQPWRTPPPPPPPPPKPPHPKSPDSSDSQQPQHQQHKSFSPQHTSAAASPQQTFQSSRGYQTLPARSRAKPAAPAAGIQDPQHSEVIQQQQQQQISTLNSSPSLPLTAEMPASSLLQSAGGVGGGSSCSLPVGGFVDSAAAATAPEPWHRVVAEIVTTEAAYVKDLGVLVDGYVMPMKQEDQFSPETVQTVFCNLDILCEFHRGLLQRLERHRRSLREFCHAFVECLPGFQQYAAYCINFPSSLAHLEELQSQPEIRAYLVARQQQLELSLPLQTYLLKPVQRILKYHLLLLSLQKAAPSGDADRHVKAALDAMTSIASNINDLQRRHEHALRVEELKSLLKSANLDIGSLGELVREDSFRIHGHKGARQVFLFHKAILLTKRLQNGCLAIKEIIRCANLMLIESIPKEPLSFHILPFDNPKCQLTLQARRADQKAQWCRDIKRLIIENYEATIPEKAKLIVLNMSELIHQNCNGGGPPPPESLGSAQQPAGAGRARHRNYSAGRRDMQISSPERIRRNNSDELDVSSAAAAASQQRSRPVSRCYSSTEDLGDLLRYHEEALKEIFSRSTRYDSSSDSSAEADGEGGPAAGPDADFTSIAIEINEEVLGFYGTSPRTSGLAPTASHNHGHGGHRRQPSAGRGADIIRAAIDKSTAAAVASAAAAAPALPPSPAPLPPPAAAGNGNGGQASPIYIHCPKGNYDNVVFGRAYERYIEKTKKKIALDETDIDEILRPLRQLRVDTSASGTASAAAGDAAAAFADGGSPPSSADSSPRRIVSRIATSFGVVAGGAAAPATRVIQVADLPPSAAAEASVPAASAKQQRSQSVVSAVLGEIKSAWRKNSTANAAAAAAVNPNPLTTTNNSSNSSSGAPLRRNDSASSDSGVFTHNQQQQKQLQQRKIRAPAPPAPNTTGNKNSNSSMMIMMSGAGTNGNNGSNSNASADGSGGGAPNSVQKFIRSFATKDAMAKHESDILRGVIPPAQRLVPGARPPPPPVPRSQEPAPVPASAAAAAPTSAPVARKSRKAPSPPPPSSSSHATALETLPYADEEDAAAAAGGRGSQQQQHQNWRRTKDWSQDNLYWKRALLDPPPPAKPPRPPTGTPGPVPAVTAAQKPAPLAKCESAAAAAAVDPTTPAGAEEEDEEAKPRRGTVASLVNRFQHN